MTAQHHQGMWHCVQQELILIMEKEYVALVLVVKCVQTHRNNLMYAFIDQLVKLLHNSFCDNNM